MERPHDYTKEDDKFSEAVYAHVRPGGPKSRRLSKSLLEGHLEKRHLHYFKVTQELFEASQVLSDDQLKHCFENHFGDVGDVYRPYNQAANEPWNFQIVGLYKHLEAEMLEKTHTIEIDGVRITADIAADWFLEMYPRPFK